MRHKPLVWKPSSFRSAVAVLRWLNARNTPPPPPKKKTTQNPTKQKKKNKTTPPKKPQPLPPPNKTPKQTKKSKLKKTKKTKKKQFIDFIKYTCSTCRRVHVHSLALFKLSVASSSTQTDCTDHSCYLHSRQNED